jgi:hypothetical protein
LDGGGYAYGVNNFLKIPIDISQAGGILIWKQNKIATHSAECRHENNEDKYRKPSGAKCVGGYFFIRRA